jgi:type IV secretion system protein VirB6
MVLMSRMVKILLVVMVAKTVAVTGSDFYHFINATLPQEVNYIITVSANSPKNQIDRNLLKVSAATSAIDMVQIPAGDSALAVEKARTTLRATTGIAGPAMSSSMSRAAVIAFST